MKFLNLKATIVFTQLVDTLKEGQYRKILNEPYMPLTIEKVGERINTPWGLASLYSFCHYYEQNGDLMQDPEMCFFMLDNREGFSADFAKVLIAPYIFRQANLAIYEESVLMESDSLTKFHRPMQKGHTDFANQWLANIQQQGFLNR
ncbi:hypothetical protein J7E50_10845 [Pedobacter sp. ISL-68]|uniref:DUF6908 domain-containing protein n=1 Tax=unclassified Pedobacter TaxID=2628915 RepID=UPI001BEA14EB|nr:MULTISPECIES: hypothetical protein [unclassified Pedobacter]MBT2561329.1 hypothetical protein [Pedobacter sp. ISL-64]MBT2590718.1 hypothetical protein [Pedobacter sp. ISL-68]